MRSFARMMIPLPAIMLAVVLASGCTEAKGRGVNEVANDPGALTGPITMIGVMAGKSQDPAVFGIMDKQELKCNSPNCNKVIIPVRYQGKMPVAGDEVLITGKFVNEGNGYLLNAEKVKVLKNHRK